MLLIKKDHFYFESIIHYKIGYIKHDSLLFLFCLYQISSFILRFILLKLI